MRQEKEVIASVLSVAMQLETVRAVVRTNLLPKREYVHSYEFYFIVNDTDPFEDDVFGDVQHGEAFGKRAVPYL